MELKQSIDAIFNQLSTVLLQLNNDEYSRQSKILFGATIGQHVRHIIELFLCLDKGYNTGIINYENRERNIFLENDRMLALDVLSGVCKSADRQDRVLLLQSSYSEHTEAILLVPTNYYREIIYNVEHAVHHMALIRVGIHELTDMVVPENFGLATSTIKYQRRCAR